MTTLRLLRLRLWARLVARRAPGRHIVAELIAAGEWRALDQVCADLDATAPTPGVGKWQ